ncbi:aspartate/glutamate racemase family protein [Sinomonas sp. ASV322]|uniref:aspartate/glutamate racemase family protein n=1 Tax=Sinomonas sp. ASV322 TaxID=3041920 RepID=UPI0027DCE5C6|nr:aspartate/glutamate racemase family protein [Sinomonas sp. ASV322]MDQ4504297.1 aspartate/glutamate racemase family protein [Sinomonas sp. ASV322]
MRPLLLINPNTSESTTLEMLSVARASAPPLQEVVGLTAAHGAALIDDEAKLETSAEAVVDVVRSVDLAGYRGVIVSAFGDPGLEALRLLSPVPVTGIAEAGIIEAARDGRRFSIVTTTPKLASAINKKVIQCGFGHLYAGLRLTEGPAEEVMKDPDLLEASLARACEDAVSQDATEAIVIGGGPLAVSAASLRWRFPVPIIEPVPAAVRLALTRADDGDLPRAS